MGVAVATTGIVTGAIDKTLAVPGVAIIGTGLLLIFIGCLETKK
ncbi:MAG: hypothetical protein OXE42_18495 [Gammaproteobacteria bacterium]|nr:hypothetical protein [Gammaproteobacteria bacterium]